MKTTPGLNYPENERPALDELRVLFEEWCQCFAHEIGKVQEQGEYFRPDHMVCDGFYPNYFSKSPRVLFVGRESMGMSGQNYIESMFSLYTETKKFGRPGDKGEIHLNRSKFQTRLLKLAHAFNNGLPPWAEIPQASKIGDNFGTAEGASCAFMNLSKFSNEDGTWQAKWPLIKTSNQISESGRFCEKQVHILKPDLTITMNLGDSLKLLGATEKQLTIGKHALYKLESCGHSSWLIDTFHFSAWQKHDIRDFYQPICELVRGHLPHFMVSGLSEAGKT